MGSIPIHPRHFWRVLTAKLTAARNLLHPLSVSGGHHEGQSYVRREVSWYQEGIVIRKRRSRMSGGGMSVNRKGGWICQSLGSQ